MSASFASIFANQDVPVCHKKENPNWLVSPLAHA